MLFLYWIGIFNSLQITEGCNYERIKFYNGTYQIFYSTIYPIDPPKPPDVNRNWPNPEQENNAVEENLQEENYEDNYEEPPEDHHEENDEEIKELPEHFYDQISYEQEDYTNIDQYHQEADENALDDGRVAADKGSANADIAKDDNNKPVIAASDTALNQNVDNPLEKDEPKTETENILTEVNVDDKNNDGNQEQNYEPQARDYDSSYDKGPQKLDYDNGQQDNNNDEKDYYNGSPNYNNGPQDYNNEPPNYNNGPPIYNNGPPNYNNGPQYENNRQNEYNRNDGYNYDDYNDNQYDQYSN